MPKEKKQRSWWWRWTRSILFTWLGLIIALVGVIVLQLTVLKPEASTMDEGMKALEFPHDSRWLNTEEPLSMEELKGQVVLLDFWTYCCINCLHALPALAKLEEHYADQPVTVIGVHSGKFGQEHIDRRVQDAIAKYEVKHPVVMDDAFKIWNAWGVRAWPTLIVVDAAGNVAHTQSGEPDHEALGQIVDKLLAQGREAGILADPHETPKLKQVDEKTGPLRFPGKILATAKNLFVADSGNHRILILDKQGHVQHTIGGPDAGDVDGSFAEARFHEPQGLAIDGDNLYVADRKNHKIRQVDLKAQTVETIAGTGKKGGYRMFAGEPLKIDLRSPWALQLRDGGLDIAMAGSHQIWRLELAENRIEVLAGSGLEQIIDGGLRLSAFAQPSGLTLIDHNLYVADSETSAVRKIDLQEGEVSTLVGTGLFDYGFKDGVGTEALLQHPLGIAGHGETLYIADSFNNALRALNLGTSEVKTLLPKGVSGLKEPSGISLFENTLYVADTNNHRLVEIDLQSLTAAEVPVLFE